MGLLAQTLVRLGSEEDALHPPALPPPNGPSLPPFRAVTLIAASRPSHSHAVTGFRAALGAGPQPLGIPFAARRTPAGINPAAQFAGQGA